PLRDAGVPILGTSPDAIDRAEDRQRFNALIAELGLHQAAGATARSLDEARVIAVKIGYPVLVRPSYVLGGRAMRIVPDDQALGVIGLINVQFAIRNDTIYVLDVNPRASRTVPFVSKAIGLPLAKIAMRVALGETLEAWLRWDGRDLPHIAVKESVFPFVEFP